MEEGTYEAGDIVWAHVYGHPWWPAQVIKTPGMFQCQVRFFLTSETQRSGKCRALLDEKQIRSYDHEENRKKYGSLARKSKRLRLAIEEADSWLKSSNHGPPEIKFEKRQEGRNGRSPPRKKNQPPRQEKKSKKPQLEITQSSIEHYSLENEENRKQESSLMKKCNRLQLAIDEADNWLKSNTQGPPEIECETEQKGKNWHSQPIKQDERQEKKSKRPQFQLEITQSSIEQDSQENEEKTGQEVNSLSSISNQNPNYNPLGHLPLYLQEILSAEPRKTTQSHQAKQQSLVSRILKATKPKKLRFTKLWPYASSRKILLKFIELLDEYRGSNEIIKVLFERGTEHDKSFKLYYKSPLRNFFDNIEREELEQVREFMREHLLATLEATQEQSETNSFLRYLREATSNNTTTGMNAQAP